MCAKPQKCERERWLLRNVQEAPEMWEGEHWAIFAWAAFATV